MFLYTCDAESSHKYVVRIVQPQIQCLNRSDKHTAQIVATNTLPGDLVPQDTKSPGDLVPRGIKLLGVPNHRDTAPGLSYQNKEI